MYKGIHVPEGVVYLRPGWQRHPFLLPFGDKKDIADSRKCRPKKILPLNSQGYSFQEMSLA